MVHEVFISYAAEDIEAAKAICSAIESHGIKCWYAKRDVVVGKVWFETVPPAIDASKVMFFISSYHSNRSAPVKREIERASGKGIPIITIRIDYEPIEPSLEFLIGVRQWLDAQEPPLSAHMPQLIETVEQIINQQKETEKHAEEERKKVEAARLAREAATQLKEKEEAQKKAALEAEKTAREIEQLKAESVKARKEAEEAIKAREAALKAVEDAAQSVKEKEQLKLEAARAKKEAEEAIKAREAALKAVKDAEQSAEEREKFKAEAAKARKEAQEAIKAKEAALKTAKETEKSLQERQRQTDITVKPRKSTKAILIGTISIILVAVIVVIALKFISSGEGPNTPTVTTTPAKTLATESGFSGNITTTPPSPTSTTPPTTISSPPSVAPLKEYEDINFNPTVINTNEVFGTETFYITLSGNFTCIKDIPYTIGGIMIKPKITGKHTTTNAEVTLICSDNISSDSVPIKQGETTSFNQTISVNFPADTPNGYYNLFFSAEQIKVNIGLWVSIEEFFQLIDQSIGSVQYTQQRTTAGRINDNFIAGVSTFPIAINEQQRLI